MAAFLDSYGREWRLRITLADLPKIRECGLNVTQALRDPNQFDPLGDPEVIGRVLWVLCESQASERGVTPEQFAGLFDGPMIAAATEAFIEALADFSQRPAVAAEAKKNLPGAWAKIDRERIEKLKRMTSGLNDTAGSSPALPGSTVES